MNWDLELLLVLGVLATGIIRYADAWRYRHRPREHPEPWLVDSARMLFPMLLLVLLLRTFVAEPFRIPSESMLPTLEEGDLVLVDKYSYGLRLPLVHTRIWEVGGPARGDVVVFRFPRNPDIDYIKRIMGLPGDRVEYVDKQLRINDVLHPLRDARPYEDPKRGLLLSRAFSRYTEETSSGRTHDLLLDEAAPSLSYRFTVPAGHYLVFGDNRDYSSDSRVWGFVPEGHLVGRAFLIWMNLEYLFATFSDPGSAAWSRLGRIQ